MPLYGKNRENIFSKIYPSISVLERVYAIPQNQEFLISEIPVNCIEKKTLKLRKKSWLSLLLWLPEDYEIPCVYRIISSCHYLYRSRRLFPVIEDTRRLRIQISESHVKVLVPKQFLIKLDRVSEIKGGSFTYTRDSPVTGEKARAICH